MSGIAGIYNLDGRPADGSLLRRMTDVIAHRGPDGMGHWIEGPVAFGHRMLHTTPESLLEEQPLTDESGTLCLTLDGRVDNRDELEAALKAKGFRLRNSTDAELVLRAYECWGEECPEKILGDFAFAIWDGRKQQLFCARDIIGLKPFYYYSDGRRFLFASELHQILEDPAIPRKPNEGMIGEYLANVITSNEETLFEGIFRLPSAHSLVIGRSGKMRKARYWDIDPSRETRYRTDEEYAEAFREIFQEAVRCRLRSHRTVGSHLSGGLDSSSIVCMAAWLLRQGLAPSPGLRTFSMVFPGLACDESPYIQAVVEKWHVESNLLEAEDSDPNWYHEEARRYLDIANFPNAEFANPVLKSAQSKGIRVLLSGLAGDHCLTGSLAHLSDLLRRFQWVRLARQCRWDARALTSPEYTESARHLLVRYGVWYLLPQRAQQIAKRLLGRESHGVPSWIPAEFARQTGLAERLRPEEIPGANFQSIAQRFLSASLRSSRLSFAGELHDRVASAYGLEYRHPYLDRRLLEFALAIPEEQRWRREETKFVLRQAMRDLLPEQVRRRRTKADFSHLFPEAIIRLGGKRCFDSLTIASLGWVEGEQVRRMYDHMMSRYQRGQSGYGYCTYMWQLWMIFAIELWFRTVFSSNARASSVNMAEAEPVAQTV